MSEIQETFGSISEEFKLFKENTKYDSLPQQTVTFNSKEIELIDYNNLSDIMREINNISGKLFMYGMIFESQNRVLQQLEDEFEMWYAKRFSEVDALMPPPIKATEKRTDKARDMFIKTHFEVDYRQYKDKLGLEKYKLGIIKRVVSSLESYGFKLHALKEYNMVQLSK
ncbi:MAG TPA: hypothetical protein P5136_00470 [Methanofastidiosum sp.]|nr:hypothetical protein [Methanofastidiosum sp.]